MAWISGLEMGHWLGFALARGVISYDGGTMEALAMVRPSRPFRLHISTCAHMSTNEKCKLKSTSLCGVVCILRRYTTRLHT